MFDGAGREWEGRLGDRSFEPMAEVSPLPEPPYPVILAMAMLPAQAMDWVVQKAAELGATHVVPVVTERVQVRLDAAKAQKKRAHWQAIAVGAAEQCGRAVVLQVLLPAILTAQPWREVAPQARVVPLVPGAPALAGQSRPQGPVVFAVGPEGGWSESEIRWWQAVGQPAGLGARILRAETAALAALAGAMALGWW